MHELLLVAFISWDNVCGLMFTRTVEWSNHSISTKYDQNVRSFVKLLLAVASVQVSDIARPLMNSINTECLLLAPN